MDLSKFIPLKTEDKSKEHYWSLVIEPGWVAAGIWKVEDGKAKILVFSPSVAWEEKEELINACDSALSVAVQNLATEDSDLTKTVFGVSSSWVQNGEIKEANLSMIKEVCSKLSLAPIGFVVIPEAISHFIKNDEGESPNIVAIGVYKEVIDISVFRAGKLVGATQVSRSVNLDEDVIEGISRFIDDDQIPTRFILYNSKEGELEEARQSLVKVNWEDYKDLKLLHTPKIEILALEKKIAAVCLAGASEIANINGLEMPDVETGLAGDLSKMVSEDQLNDLPKVFTDSDKSSELIDQHPHEQTVAIDSHKKLENPVGTPLNKVEANMDTDFSRDTFNPEEVSNVSTPTSVAPFTQTQRRKINFNLRFLTGMFSFLAGPFEKKPFVFGLAILMVVVVGCLALWWYYPKATVTVFVTPNKLEEKLTLRIQTDGSPSNFSENLLAGKVELENVSGERTKETTGTKIVGDRAKGEVTLYRVGPPLTIKGGTILTGPDDLRFVINETVNIATGSAGSPGTAKSGVVSEGIGAQYNLSSGSKFSVGNFSLDDIEAKNESAFSGGSSRETSAVSKEDREMLYSQLEEELVGKATENASQKIDTSNTILIKDAVSVDVKSENFNNKVGDEASTLKLELDLDVSVLSLDKEEINKYIFEKLAGRIPSGYTMPDSQVSYRFELSKKEDKFYDFTVYVSANLVSEINKLQIAEKIRGRHVSIADDILEKEVSGYRGVQIKIKPALTGRLKTLPHVLKNITVEISSED